MRGTWKPYAEVSLVDDDKICYKSMIHRVPYEAGTLNPKWDYGFYLGGSELNLRTTNLMFEVFDYDQWSADDVMGSCEFPLKVFDKDEQDLIRRAQRLRKKGGTMGKAYSAVRDRYNALTPAFLPGFGKLSPGGPSEAQGSQGDKIPGMMDLDDDDDDDDEDEAGTSHRPFAPHHSLL